MVATIATTVIGKFGFDHYVLEAFKQEDFNKNNFPNERPKLSEAMKDHQALAARLAVVDPSINRINLNRLGDFYPDSALVNILKTNSDNKKVLQLVFAVIANQIDRITSFIELVAQKHHVQGETSQSKQSDFSFTTQEGYQFSVSKIYGASHHGYNNRKSATYKAEFKGIDIQKSYQHHGPDLTLKVEPKEPYELQHNPYGWYTGSYGENVILRSAIKPSEPYSGSTGLDYELGINSNGHMIEKAFQFSDPKTIHYQIQDPDQDDKRQAFERARIAFGIKDANDLFYNR